MRNPVGGAGSCGSLAEAPAFFITLALCAAIGLREELPLAAAVTAALFVSGGAALAASRGAPRGWFPLFILILLLSAAASCFSIWRMGRCHEFPNSFEFNGRVLSSVKWGKSRALLLSTPYGVAAACIDPKAAPPAGSGVWARVSSFEFKRAKVRGGFDELRFWRSRGAEKRLVVFEIRETAPPSGLPAWRARIDELYARRLPPLTAAYMSALTTGGRDEAAYAPHKRAGTAHLLAISGFHVGLLAALLLCLLRRRPSRFVLVSAAVWLYAAIAGFPAGGLRAALMTQIWLAALMAGRPSSAFNSVSAAALLMLLWNPWYFYDVGWRLSVLSALFITAAAPLLGTGAAGGALISLLLWFIDAPLAAAAFKATPVAGLAANLVAVPWFSILFPVTALLSMPALLSLSCAWLPAAAAEALLGFSSLALDRLAALFPGSVVCTPALAAASAALFFGAAALRCGAKVRYVPFIALIFVLFLFYSPSML